MATAKRIEFPDRESWLAHRKTGLGGSDIIIALGYGKWKSPYALWAEKSSKVEPEPVESVAAWLGHVMEPPMADWFQQETGRFVKDPGEFTIYTHPDRPHLFVTPDRLYNDPSGSSFCKHALRDDGYPLSIKTTGDPEAIEIWESGEATAAGGAQINMEMEILGKCHGAFAVMTFGWQKERLWFDVERNDAMIADMMPKLDEFWERVQNGDPPPVDGSESTQRTIYRMHPDDSGAVVELPSEVVKLKYTWQMAADAIARHTEILDTTKNQIRHMIGDATFGRYGDTIWSNRTIQNKDSVKVDLDAVEWLEEYGVPHEVKPGAKYRKLIPVKSIG